MPRKKMYPQYLKLEHSDFYVKIIEFGGSGGQDYTYDVNVIETEPPPPDSAPAPPPLLHGPPPRRKARPCPSWSILSPVGWPAAGMSGRS